MYLGVSVYVRTYMEQNSFWEDNTAPPSQESPRILWNPNVHNSLPLTHFLTHINEVNSLRPSLWIIILILSSCPYPGPSSGPFPHLNSPKFCVHISSCPVPSFPLFSSPESWVFVEELGFTNLRNNRQNCNYVYFIINFLRKQENKDSGSNCSRGSSNLTGFGFLIHRFFYLILSLTSTGW